jgi:dipeptidyl aminopeptidase
MKVGSNAYVPAPRTYGNTLSLQRQAQNIRPLPDSLSPEGASAYLDVIPTPDGYDHIALFDTANSNTPRFLTSGNWEVTGGIKAIDVERGLV